MIKRLNVLPIFHRPKVAQQRAYMALLQSSNKSRAQVVAVPYYKQGYQPEIRILPMYQMQRFDHVYKLDQQH